MTCIACKAADHDLEACHTPAAAKVFRARAAWAKRYGKLHLHAAWTAKAIRVERMASRPQVTAPTPSEYKRYKRFPR